MRGRCLKRQKASKDQTRNNQARSNYTSYSAGVGINNQNNAATKEASASSSPLTLQRITSFSSSRKMLQRGETISFSISSDGTKRNQFLDFLRRYSDERSISFFISSDVRMKNQLLVFSEDAATRREASASQSPQTVRRRIRFSIVSDDAATKEASASLSPLTLE